MAEEVTAPAQAAPSEAAPAPAPDKPRKDGPLLPILTALLIVVGIADVILWGVVGYYLL